MPIDEEMLMAFADGGLTGAEAEAVANAVAADPALAAKLAEHRRLRETLARAFDPVLEAAPPPALLAAATASTNGNIVDLGTARQQRQGRIAGLRKAFGERWGSMAAALAVGVIAGHVLSLDRGLLRERGGELVARTELAEALDEQLASDDPVLSDSPVKIGITFRNQRDQYCRTFSPAQAESMAGIACHHDGYWEIRMAAAADMAQTGAAGYRTAGSDAAVLAAAQAMMKGEPFDAAAERKARAEVWR